jgi:hypothetical protein
MTDQEIADQLFEDSDGELDMTSANVGIVRRSYGVASGREQKSKRSRSATRKTTARTKTFIVIQDAEEWENFPIFYKGDDEEIADAAEARREFYNEAEGNNAEKNRQALIDLAEYLDLAWVEVEASNMDEAYDSVEWE